MTSWAQAVLDMQSEALAAVEACTQKQLQSRQPLQRRKAAQQGLKTFNPRFEDDFALGKDFDPDRCSQCSCCMLWNKVGSPHRLAQVHKSASLCVAPPLLSYGTSWSLMARTRASMKLLELR